MPPYLYVENDRAVEQPVLNSPGNKPDGSRGAFWRPGPIAPGFDLDEVLPTLTERSVQFIRHGPRKRQPFFLYFAMTGPHTPWLPTAKFHGRSRAGDYGDFVAQVDDSVGQVLQAIDRDRRGGQYARRLRQRQWRLLGRPISRRPVIVRTPIGAA